MAILTKNEIKKALKKGLIKIEPLEESQIGPASVDLTLGNDFRVFKKRTEPYPVRDDANFADITEAVSVKGGQPITVNPGEMVLAVTREKVTLAENLAGRLEGRTRFARFGLSIHVTAGFVNPGASCHQVLEIVNHGRSPLALYPGTRICQFVFETCRGKAKYAGRFAGQTKP